jgi:ATP-binding cassette, subfamily B, bacterial
VNLLRLAAFLMSLGLRVDRTRLIRAVLLMFTGYLAAPFASLAIGRFTDQALAHHAATALALALLTAVLLVAQLMLSHFAHLDYFELAELQEAALRTELISLVNGPVTVEHLDSPQFADDVGLVREGLFSNTRALEGVLQLGGLLLQTVVTVAILVTVSPWLAVLPLAAVPPVLAGRRAESVLERARESCAEQMRLHQHLLELATDAAAVKEIRVFGAAAELLRREDAIWREITNRICRGQTAGAALRSLGQLTFAVAYGVAILLITRQAVAGKASIGDLILVITLAIQVSAQITGALQLMSVLQSASRTVSRIEAMRRATRAARPAARPLPAPAPLRSGITLADLGFTYPGWRTPALRDICLHIPAGHTLALVGENGAGKSTLVNLLCGLYLPTQGRILVEGVDLAGIDPVSWRAGVASLFQDFFRFELTLRESVGLGSLDLLPDTVAVRQALAAAQAGGIPDIVPGGLDGVIGRGYEPGTELSGGQWQAVGLARCLLRAHPHLLILDEPAAALDAAAEHALFDRYASSARAAARARGSVTVLVSHRFSTVRMADTIAVLEKGRLIEYGSHTELMERGGLYADLFTVQARVYG